MLCQWLLSVLLNTAMVGSDPPDRFIVFSEFQVWADAASPQVFKELNKLYLEKGRSHVFNLYPHYEYFVWRFPRMKEWVDEAAALKAFNVFCLGDDTRTAEGRLFDGEGVNPRLKDFLFRTVSYAHERGLMVAVEPTGLPAVKDKEHLVPWLRSWLGPEVPRAARADVVKLSIEWFGAYRNNPQIAEEVEAFFDSCRQVNPDVMIYLDSIGGIWRKPQPFHCWFLRRFPGTIISHYLNTDQLDAFRAAGARNMMVQINPSEMEKPAGQFFIYHDKTVAFLQDVVRKRVRYVSLAGVNFGYSRYNYDLFLEVIRPHLALAPDVETLRRTLQPDQVAEPATKDDVRKWLIEQAKK
ncbi:MAG TPA: hypothetical protein PKY77_11315 [Phycisphaerae bacterium]|nr:hypothetical protein [Phycisphaerae bacterium]HRY70310.1 hypothetical protein [Phycisphaerae bacterium]HSA28027.1 hypothetical protein [Phycisphaerae bacterium]